MRTRFIIWVVLIIFVSVFTGCSGTTLKFSNKNSQFTGKVNKVYIIGFANNQDTRRWFEDAVAETFTSYGLTGVSSYQDQPDLSEINDDTITNQIPFRDLAHSPTAVIADGSGCQGVYLFGYRAVDFTGCDAILQIFVHFNRNIEAMGLPPS